MAIIFLLLYSNNAHSKLGLNYTSSDGSHLCVVIGLGFLTTTIQLKCEVIVECIVIRNGTHDSCGSFQGGFLERGGCNFKSAATHTKSL